MALLYSPPKYNRPVGSPCCKHSAGRPAAHKGLGGDGKAPGRAMHPQARCVQATGGICVHLRREVSFPGHRSVISAELIAYPTFSVCMHEKV